MIKYLVVILISLCLFIVGCKNKSTIYFYSLDKSQCITIISEYDYRYVINGKHNQPPDSNYVKLQLEDRNSMWDNLYICWENNKYKWDIVLEHCTILESKLDTSKFTFNVELPNDKRGIPTAKKFSYNSCATYLFSLKKFIPEDQQGAIVEYN